MVWTSGFRSFNGITKSGTGTVEGDTLDLRGTYGSHAMYYSASRTAGAVFTVTLQGSITGAGDWADLGVFNSGTGDPNSVRGLVVVLNKPAQTVRAILNVTTAGSGDVSGLYVAVTSKE